MKIGVPKEVKNREYRVALTPIGVHELVQHSLALGLNTNAGELTNAPVGTAVRIDSVDLAAVLA